MTRSHFYPSLILLILLNAVIKPIWIFAIDRQVQNQVGAESYGHYFSLFNLSVVLSFISDLGFTTYYNRQLAAADKTLSIQPGSFLFLKLLLVLLYAAIVLLVAWFAGIERWDLILYVIFIQAFTSLFLFLRSIITANQWFVADAWLSVTDKTLMIFLSGALLYFPAIAGGISVQRFAMLQAACIAIAMIIACSILLKRGISFQLRSFHLPGKHLFIQVLPFALIVLLMSAHTRLDAFLLERINNNGAYEAGVYASAYRLLDAANMVGYLLASFLLPYIARQWSTRQDLQEVVLTIRHFLLLFSIGLITVTVFLAPWIQVILYHRPDENAATVLRYCLPALAGYALTQVYGTVLTATGHIRPFCVITGISLFINILLNLFLIPGLGAKGCCIAAVISQSFNGIAVMLYAQRKLSLSLHLRSILLYLFTTLLLGSFLYFTRDLAVSKWVLITAAILITFVIMLGSKMIRLRTAVRLGRYHP